MVAANGEALREALNDEKKPEVKWKLSFSSLVGGGMRLEEAAAHFGICITTGYKCIHRWNSEGVEGLARNNILGRPPKLDGEELGELKSVLQSKPYWSVKEVMMLVKVGKHYRFHKEGDEKHNPGKAIIVVLDNLKRHKGEEVKAEAEQLVIELVFLLSYSRDLNPIEYVGTA